MTDISRKTWIACNEIVDGFAGHYFKNTIPQCFDKVDGTNATYDKENIDIAATKYSKIFNHDYVAPNFTVVDDINPLDMNQDIKDTIALPLDND